MGGVGGADPSEMRPAIAAILACHNRRALTVRALGALYAQGVADLAVFVLDDGSTDGTGDAIRAAFPDVAVLDGDGSAYWGGGMRIAWAAAMEGGADRYLWLNDDTVLGEGALAKMTAVLDGLEARRSAPVLLAGATCDPATGTTTYGGLRRRSRRRPLALDLVEPGDEPVRVDTIHGNIVLVPQAVATQVGNIDPAFPHAFGDVDYGLRAGRADVEVWLAPGIHGTCAANPAVRGDAVSTRRAWRELTSIKNLPPAAWYRYARRWGGPAWPVFWVSPYLRRARRILARSPQPVG